MDGIDRDGARGGRNDQAILRGAQAPLRDPSSFAKFMQARWGDYPSLISMIEVTSFGYYYQETRSGRYVSITQN